MTTSTLDRPTHLSWAAKVFRRTFTRLGYSSKRQDGTEWQVSICDAVYYVPRAAGLLEIDVHSLPRRVKVADLASDAVCHELSTAIGGYRVEARNRRGLVYVIWYTEPASEPEVNLPSKVELDIGSQPDTPLTVPIGAGTEGPVCRTLAQLGHTLITGTTGSGKSTWIHASLAALLTTNGPERLRLALVDPKRLEFAVWEGVPHLVDAVAHDAQQATELLSNLVAEMDRRGDVMAGELVRDLASYNAKHPDDPMPVILLIVDEAIDLALTAGSRSELVNLLARLASKARATGIYVWMAAQHPRFDVLPRTISANLVSRLAFRVKDADAARLAGVPGAHRIPRARPGRFMARIEGEPVTLQGYYLPDAKLVKMAQSLQGGRARPILSEAERQLVVHAVGALGGAFKVKDLSSDLEEWSEWGVTKLAREWERRGWLTAPAHNAAPRCVTQKLARLAGLEQVAGLPAA